MRRFIAFLVGHLLASALGASVVVGLLAEGQFWQGLALEGAWVMTGAIWGFVAAFGLPGWALLRLAAIGPRLRRGLRSGAAVLLFAGCGMANGLAVFLVLFVLGHSAQSGTERVVPGALAVMAVGTVGGALAWAGERLVGGARHTLRAAA